MEMYEPTEEELINKTSALIRRNAKTKEMGNVVVDAYILAIESGTSEEDAYKQALATLSEMNSLTTLNMSS